MDYSGKIITKNPVEPSQTSAPGVWTLDQATQAVQGNNWPIAYVPNPISRSLRFNSADSAYLNRTPASAGNRKTWTLSMWVKRSALGSEQTLLGVNATTDYTQFKFSSSDTLILYLDVAALNYAVEVPTVVWRDPSAWYHIVLAMDTTQATSTNRVKIYVNGVQQTVSAISGYNIPAQNWDTDVNATLPHAIGNFNYLNTQYLNGYLTETNFIDGQALDPTYFGMTDPRTGAWIPKKYSGTYGTNGFYLNFSDNSTTAALGTDYSGNSNTWTTNNFSVTAGSGNDSMTDVPTPWVAYNSGDVGGVIRGNYATLNPLFVNTSYPITYSNGNLDAARASGGQGGVTHTFGMSSGKWYWEVVFATYVYNIGITTNPAGSTTGSEGAAGYNDGGGTSIGLQPNGVLRTNGTAGSTYTSWTTGDVMGIALDMDGGNLYFYKNGTAMNSGSPVATSLTGSTWFFITSLESGASLVANFGQRPFAYSPPAGFKSLCTTNLPEPTILDGGDYMNAVLYTGNGSTQSITGVGFQPDWTWIKRRSAASDHELFDVLRGATKDLFSNTTDAETTISNSLTSFDTDGFTTGANGGTNSSGGSFVAWNWKAGGTGVSNTDGSITSTVSANPTAGFSVVTYTGTGSNATIGHGLGYALSFLILKRRDASSGGGSDWPTWHKALTGDQYLSLSGAGGYGTLSSVWNGSVPTSSVFSTGTAIPAGSYVAYCFAPVAGYSAFGSYSGNSNADGPFVYCGFRPRYILLKDITSSGNNWLIHDTARNTYNVVNLNLAANLSDADGTFTALDIVSNGFKLRNSNNNWNGSGNTYIYAAFAENPFKYSNAR